MKRSILLPLLFVLFFVLPTGALATGKHALLIGIQDYGYHAIFSSLNGPENDLKITEEVLRKRFGFQEKDFIILRNEQATHTGIEDAFKALIERVNPGDFVYLYYSGHGSQTDDLNDDELDGRDETWVSYGARKDESEHKDNYDVLDDEIDAWLTALYEKTNNVVFVSDSCHSATVSRGQAAITRAVEKDTRSHPLGKESYAQPVKHPGVRVGAARDRESAIEIPTEDDQYYGLFTWHWVRALQQAKDEETWNDVYKRAYTQVTAGRGSVQRPQLWGERDLQVIGGDFTALNTTIPVTNVDGDLVTIQAGYLSGVTVGSVYHLYDPANPRPPILTITELKTFESIGKAEGSFKKGDLVIEELHAYPFSALKIYLDADYPDDYDKPLLQVIWSAFQGCPDETPGLPAYTLTNNPHQADLHLYLVRPKCKDGQCIPESNNDPLPKSFPDQSPEVWILTPEHRLLYENWRIQVNEQNPARGIQVLQENLNKFARIRELKALGASRDSTLQITAEAYLLTPVAPCQEGPDCKFLSDDLGFYQVTGPHSLQEVEKQRFRKGDILTFTLHNTSEQAYYYYLINIAPDGTIEAIFPPPEEELDYALVKAGKKRELINDVGLMMEPGEETIKFIVSRQPFDVFLLEMEGFEMRGGRKGEYNPLEQLLVNAMYGHRGRVSLRNDEWTTKQLSFEVEIKH